MEALTTKEQIQETYLEYRDISFEQKTSPLMTEEGINEFLDSINNVKNTLNNFTKGIDEIVDRGDKLTWLNTKPDTEDMKGISAIVAMLKDINGSLLRQYIGLSGLRKKGIAKVEIMNFKESIDDVKELYEDLENTFFNFPEMPEFKEANNILAHL